jgi:transcriptional regulator with XRE-family HTH domain
VTATKEKTAAHYSAAEERELNIVGKRIAEARSRSGLSLVSFSRLLKEYGISISAAGISKWELGGSVPSAYQILAVCRALGIDDGLGYFSRDGLCPELSEAGLRKLYEYRADLVASGRYRPRAGRENVIRYIDMPVSALPASAGTGAFLGEDTFENVSFPESEVPANAEFGLQVSGDSMEPVYHDGQIVWVQKCKTLAPGEVGIFIYDGDGYIKVYGERVPDEGDRDAFTDSTGAVHMQPVMISYNKAYEPRPISPEAGFQIVGRVVH